MSFDTSGNWIESFSILQKGECRDHLQEIAGFFYRKLWHQISKSLETLLDAPYFDKSQCYELYTSFICSFQSQLNQLQLAHMIVKISTFLDTSKAIEFLSDRSAEFKDCRIDCFVLVKSTLGRRVLQMGDINKAKEILDELENEISNINTSENAVYSSLYLFISKYYQAKVEPEEFFKYTLTYLSYTPLDSLSLDVQQELAFNLCISALAGQKVYSFGELLGHGIVESLAGNQHEWALEILKTFNRGDIYSYDQLTQKHSHLLQSNDLLVKNSNLLNQKISILSVMELIFNRNSEDRVVSFQDISRAANISLDKVEVLLIRALSLGLIRGVIDQVEQNINISWVQPRALNLEQVKVMKARLSAWKQKVTSLREVAKEATPELFA